MLYVFKMKDGKIETNIEVYAEEEEVEAIAALQAEGYPVVPIEHFDGTYDVCALIIKGEAMEIRLTPSRVDNENEAHR